MPASSSFQVHALGVGDITVMEAMLTMFGEVFEDVPTYSGKRPSAEYLARLLACDDFIAIAAIKGDEVVGGLAAYVLHKFEQARKEIYLYDLAVVNSHRREGIATALIGELGAIAVLRDAYVIFVQADPGDEPAIALYTKLGAREDVLHFDIVPPNGLPNAVGGSPVTKARLQAAFAYHADPMPARYSATDLIIEAEVVGFTAGIEKVAKGYIAFVEGLPGVNHRCKDIQVSRP